MERGCTCFLYFPQIFKWALSPERSHADRGLKYFRLLAESAVDMCRPFLYTVLVVSVFSQPQLTAKNEIGNPFGKVYLFFRWGCFCWYCAIFISHPPAAEKSIFMLLLQSSSFLNIGSAASFLWFPAPHWHSGAEPMHRNMLLAHLVWRSHIKKENAKAILHKKSLCICW